MTNIVIPAEAVDAAAEALAAEDLVPGKGPLYRRDARAALEAAMPYIKAALESAS